MVTLGTVEGFVVIEEAGRVKGRRCRGAKDVGIGVEFAKGPQERFLDVCTRLPLTVVFDGHFPIDGGGVVVEAEAFVPDGVELGGQSVKRVFHV